MATTLHHPQIPDSVNIAHQPDTVITGGAQEPFTQSNTSDSSVGYFPKMSAEVIRQHAAALTVVPKTETTDTISVPRKESKIEWNTNKNFFVENGLAGIVTSGNNQQHTINSPLYSSTLRPSKIQPQHRVLDTNDWLLGIFLLLVFLFIWIRIFYSKFFVSLAKSLGSFHMAAKLFREKNVLSYRVSIVLDFVYMVVFSVFVFELFTYLNFSPLMWSGFKLFLLLLNIMMMYALSRIFLLRLTGTLFLIQPLFSEYIHNTFLINKGLGIALFPIVIMVQYFPNQLIPATFILGVIIFSGSLILKTIRVYQIIMRKDILLFYLILYLCTLEILPLLLGYKFVTSLIKSY